MVTIYHEFEGRVETRLIEMIAEIDDHHRMCLKGKEKSKKKKKFENQQANIAR